MRDYSKGKIYHIVCNLTGETYYGSTVQKISQRMNGHRNKDSECCSKPIIERGDYYYGLVEDFKCDNNEQLLMRERYYVDNNDCVNKKTPIRTKEEGAAMRKAYYEEHNEEILAYKKAYREENHEKFQKKARANYEEHKDEIMAYNKEWYKTNKDRILATQKTYQQEHKEKIAARTKAYREKHIEDIAARNKAYYEANREKISARRKAKRLLKKQAEK